MKGLLLILTFVALNGAAQSVEDEVKKPVLLLFDGMRKADSNMLKAAFAPQAILQTVVKNREGKINVHMESVAAFIKAIDTPHSEVYDERIRFDFIKIDSNLAFVWTPYKFYLGDQYSHCGVNSFQLVKLNSEWKIQYLIDTRRKENCP